MDDEKSVVENNQSRRFAMYVIQLKHFSNCTTTPIEQAIVALTFAQYAAKPFFVDCEPPETAIRLLAALCLSTYHLLGAAKSRN